MTKHSTRSGIPPFIGYLLALAAAIVLPLTVLAGALTWQWVEAQHEQARAALREKAEAARSGIDRFIESEIDILRTLAASPALSGEDIAAFDDEMRALARARGVTMVLRGIDGHRHADSRFARGERLPDVPLTDGEAKLANADEAFVSDLFVPSKGGPTPVARVAVLVSRDGRPRYVLSARLPADRLTAVMREAGIVTPYAGAVVDRSDDIVAQADGQEATIGSRWAADLAIDARGREWTARAADGSEALAIRHRLRSGWSVNVSVKSATLSAPSNGWLWLTIAFAGGVAALLAVLVALAFARAQGRARDQLLAERQGFSNLISSGAISQANIARPASPSS